MKTPEEIKKGLEHCHAGECAGCTYYIKIDSPFGDEMGCYDNLLPDALAYIKQLEAERDAALRDTAITCETCLYNKPKYDGFKVRNECHNPEGCHYASGLLCGWVWRGVCEENSGKDDCK